MDEHKKASASASRVIIIDDIRLNRECLAAQLAPHFTDIRCAWDLPSLVKEVGGEDPILILLNIGTAGSSTLLQISVDLVPKPRVIVLGLHEDHESEVVSCAEAGAAGLHLRTESLDHLLALMGDVEDGQARCSPEVSAILLGRVYSDAAGSVDPMNGALTARETEILRLLEEGLTNKQIASRLCVTVYTVKNHVHSLLGKLGVQSRAEATKLARAMRYGGTQGFRHEAVQRQSPNRSLTRVQ